MSFVALESIFFLFLVFFFNDTAPTQIYTFPYTTLFRSCSSSRVPRSTIGHSRWRDILGRSPLPRRSEEHTSELQSLRHLVCRLLLEKKKKTKNNNTI